MLQNTPKLARTMGLFALFAYGLGDILGAGIYALVGPVSAKAGSYLWVSFSIALGVAMLTALSYSEMCSRFPKSGGVSFFTQQAFKTPWASFVTGWLLLFVSVVSMATLARAFQGYTTSLGLSVPAPLVVFAFLIVMGLINLRGLKEASWFNIASTLVELSGLLIILGVGFYFLRENSAEVTPSISSSGPQVSWLGIVAGASLAFYAFIGFEDLANVAEEVKSPEKNLPRAILGSLVSAGFLYLLIGWTATSVAGPERLANSTAPLTEVIRVSGVPIPLALFSVIALFAVSNTCLLNSITASRLLFGLSEQKLVPQVLGRLNARYKTPSNAIIAVTFLSALLAAIGSLTLLAGATSVLILLVFGATNIALIKVQREQPRTEGFRVPIAVPCLALLANLALILVAPARSIAIGLGILILGLVIHFTIGRKHS